MAVQTILQSYPQESTEQSTGSCDKKCSGSVSGFHLAGETHSYTLDFVVKKGRVTLKDVTVVSHTTTTTALAQDLQEGLRVFRGSARSAPWKGLVPWEVSQSALQDARNLGVQS